MKFFSEQHSAPFLTAKRRKRFWKSWK